MKGVVLVEDLSEIARMIGVEKSSRLSSKVDRMNGVVLVEDLSVIARTIRVVEAGRLSRDCSSAWCHRRQRKQNGGVWDVAHCCQGK